VPVPSPNKQSVRMRRVCLELRRLRKESGMTASMVARKLGVVPSTVSRMENYGRGLSRDMLIEVLMTYNAPRPLRNALLRLHENADYPGILNREDLRLNKDTENWISFETEASVINNYEPMFIPGLLQTFPYARAVFEGGDPQLSEQEIEDRTNARIARQALLRRPHHPKLSVVVHEAALREVVGGPEVMHAQLVHLVEMNNRHDVSVRVLPFGVGAHPGMDGPFVIMDYQDLPSLVLLENKCSDLYLDEKADIRTYTLALQGIKAVAHPQDRSIELITEIAGRLS
jgi:transcriptional regulator with XRE-family HTH domain